MLKFDFKQEKNRGEKREFSNRIGISGRVKRWKLGFFSWTRGGGLTRGGKGVLND
jgi:hypothetical protein